MLTCETCGKVLPEGTSFCPNCGMPVEHTDSAAQPDAPNAPAPDTAAPESNPYAMPSGGSAPASGSIPEQSYPGTYPPGGNSGYGAQPNQPQSQPQPHPQQPYYGQQPQQNYGQPGNGGYIPPQQQGYPGGYPNYPQNYPNNSSNGKAIAGLVLGILSIVMGCVYGSGLLFGILGTIFSPAWHGKRTAVTRCKTRKQHCHQRSHLLDHRYCSFCDRPSHRNHCRGSFRGNRRLHHPRLLWLR